MPFGLEVSSLRTVGCRRMVDPHSMESLDDRDVKERGCDMSRALVLVGERVVLMVVVVLIE
jgi:hypothetical protein